MTAMTHDEFQRSLKGDAPPAALPAPLQALWWDAKGDWERAHDRAQAEDGAAAAWVHAYLHRKEGDDANAAYWYRRAGRMPARMALAAEGAAILRALLAQGDGERE